MKWRTCNDTPIVSRADVSLGGGNIWKLCVEKLWRLGLFTSSVIANTRIYTYSGIRHVERQEWRPALLIL